MTPAKTISIALIMLLGQNATAQQAEEAKPKVKLGGFIEWQTLYDTYRSLDTRDGDFYYYPLAKTTDRNGKDINQKSQLEMLALHSRLSAKFDGVEAFGAKASGMIEADFFGTSQAYVRMLRMRHAYMQLQWEKSALILGNTWHPIILPRNNTIYHSIWRGSSISLVEQISTNPIHLQPRFHKTSWRSADKWLPSIRWLLRCTALLG